jgi:hypothetical protein
MQIAGGLIHSRKMLGAQRILLYRQIREMKINYAYYVSCPRFLLTSIF